MVNPAAQRSRFLAPGDKLGKYDLIRQIAVGGMAELYLARTMGIEGFEKLVVVKRILPQFASNASFVNMFLNEARLAATLHHPNIAQVYDIGQEGTEYFFAMEYIHGEDLGRMVATATDSGVPISLDVALTLIAGLCAGLHYAHEKVGSDGRPLNVVHRDVSPSNVLVSYDGAVKLVDFGIARAGSSPSTSRGGIKGKIGYMSPEQCKGKETLDRRSDLFSVGSLLYELTTGRLPFTDETEYGVLNQIVNNDADRPSMLVPSYPLALEKIVMKALARDRTQRYESAIQLQGAIEDFAHENRLRISPLVLARLMGALFPARLEEWDSARAQGAFFVEQHVLRTLIESGKTSDSDVACGSPTLGEDTSLSPPPVLGDNEPTNIQAPLADLQRPRTPAPHVPPARPSQKPTGSQQQPTEPLPVAVARLVTPLPVSPRAGTPTPPAPSQLSRTPMPNAPGSVPIVDPLAAKGGSLVSGAGTYGSRATPTPIPPAAVLAIGDTTERVRVPTPPPTSDSDPSLMSRRRSNVPVVVLAVAGAIGAIIAAVIVLSGGDAPETTATAAPTITTVPPPVEAPTVAPVEAPTVKAPPVEAPVEAKVVEPEPAIVETREPTVTPPAAKPPGEPAVATPPKPKKPPKPAKAEVKRSPAKAEAKKPPKPEKKPEPKFEPKPEPKSEPKPEPKEPGKWNADSPFMPVRPGDKK